MGSSSCHTVGGCRYLGGVEMGAPEHCVPLHKVRYLNKLRGENINSADI